MALIRCSECGKEISDKAESCLGCGYPTDTKYKSDTIPTEESGSFYNKHLWFSHNLGLNALVLSVFSLLTLTWIIGMFTAPISLYFGVKAIKIPNIYKKSAIFGIAISSICVFMTVIVLIQIAVR